MARILITSPEGTHGPTGNATTARRWAGILRRLGHRVGTSPEDLSRADLLVALHARRSADAVRRFRQHGSERPLVVALTGTDLYRDLPHDASARRSLELADRIVFLHPLAADELTPRFRKKSVLIRQSVRMPSVKRARRPRHFQVVVLANLRRIKDPLRAAKAAGRLPAESRIQVVHAGRVLEKPLAVQARKEMKKNPRYEWRGALPGWRAKRLLAGAQLLVLSSRMEGGANVTSEAMVAGVPVLASDIPGNVGMLGRGYRGYFPVGDTDSLTELLWRSETDPEFLRSLRRSVSRSAPLYRPALEKKTWKRVLDDLGL